MDRINEILLYIQKTNPEMTREKLIEELSQKAQDYYNENEVGLVEVASLKTEADYSEKMYAITGEGRDDEWLTLKEVEEYFEGMHDELHWSLEDEE